MSVKERGYIEKIPFAYWRISLNYTPIPYLQSLSLLFDDYDITVVGFMNNIVQNRLKYKF